MFKCRRTPKLLALIWSWSNQKCWRSLSLPLSNYGILRRVETFNAEYVQIHSSSTIELSLSIFFPKWNVFSFHLFSVLCLDTQLLSKGSEVGHFPTLKSVLDTCMCQVSITIHKQSLDDLRWSKQNHGKETGHLKEKQKTKITKSGKKLNLSCMDSLWSQSKCLNLFGIWTYPIWTYLFLCELFSLPKKMKDFGRDMTNTWTYLAFELIWLELLRLGLYDTPQGMQPSKNEGNNNSNQMQVTKIWEWRQANEVQWAYSQRGWKWQKNSSQNNTANQGTMEEYNKSYED